MEHVGKKDDVLLQDTPVGSASDFHLFIGQLIYLDSKTFTGLAKSLKKQAHSRKIV